MKAAQDFINENKDRFLSELFELLRIPSISADMAYKEEVAKCADLVAKHLRDAGADNVEVCVTEGHPIVYGEKLIDPSKPTVLVYGHYDVQPADPIELWHTPPFEPTIKKTDIHPDGAIFARGSCDDKGQM
jgi:acetylornithine deacetylase/succinyl-diaminopimelate desuccinylase-like protein